MRRPHVGLMSSSRSLITSTGTKATKRKILNMESKTRMWKAFFKEFTTSLAELLNRHILSGEGSSWVGAAQDAYWL